MSSSIIGNAVKRDGSASLRSRKGTPVYECQYSYIVRCTERDEPYISVLSTPGIPTVGITVDPSGYGVCTGKSATRRTDNPLIWDVVCDFSSEIDDSSGSQGDPSSDPTTWVPIYETKFWQYQELVTKDRNGDPVVNSADQPFPSGITITRFLPMWEFFQIESAAITDEQVLARSEVTNSVAFKNRAVDTLLCTVLSSVIGRYYGALRRLTHYQLKYKSDNWKLKRLDVGTKFKTAPPVELVDAGAVVNLNGTDGQLSANEGADPPGVLEFAIYPSVSFSFLRL